MECVCAHMGGAGVWTAVQPRRQVGDDVRARKTVNNGSRETDTGYNLKENQEDLKTD